MRLSPPAAAAAEALSLSDETAPPSSELLRWRRCAAASLRSASPRLSFEVTSPPGEGCAAPPAAPWLKTDEGDDPEGAAGESAGPLLPTLAALAVSEGGAGAAGPEASRQRRCCRGRSGEPAAPPRLRLVVEKGDQAPERRAAAAGVMASGGEPLLAAEEGDERREEKPRGRLRLSRSPRGEGRYTLPAADPPPSSSGDDAVVREEAKAA